MHISLAKHLQKTTVSQGKYPHNGTHTGNSGPVSEYFVSGELTGKERDPETGLYYYGARYLDPRTSRWISADPAIWEGDYFPSAPINDQARERNQNLPGMGGIFNYVNMHVYHYGGNNPVMLIDPDGRQSRLGKAGIENMIADIDSQLNKLWAISNTTGRIWEWSGRIDRDTYGRYAITIVRTDRQLGWVNPPRPLSKLGSLLQNRSTVADVHTHPIVPGISGPGVPFSIEDIVNMDRVVYDISIVESGTKRFVVEINNREQFMDFRTRAHSEFYRDLYMYRSLGLSEEESILRALRPLSQNSNSGFTIYQSTDARKLIFEEL